MATANIKFQENYDYSPVSQQLENKGENCEKFEEECNESAPTIGTRHVQVCLYFVLGFVAFAFRVSMSVGIVAMTNPLASSNSNVTTYPQWTKRNIILSSFFWGYMTPQLFAAYAAKKYGAKWFLVGTMFTQSILSILTPLTAATFGETGIMCSRVVEGFCQGFVLPSCTHLISQWVPPQERSRFGSVVFTSGKLGTLFSIFTIGAIAASSYGWPWAFRGLGCLGIVWCILMTIFGYNSPRQHPKISTPERLYIEKNLGHDDKHHKTPWKAIITSAPAWALLIAHAGHTYAFWTLQTQMPSYLNHVMKFDMKKNGLWSSMPYLALFILSSIIGFLSDALINRGILSRSTARKVFHFIGSIVPAMALIALSYTNSNQSTQAVIMNIAAVGASSACYSGYAVNHIDLSPNHAGMMMGIINSCAQISGILAPLVVQLLVTNQMDPLQWRSVFLITAAVHIVTAIVFVIFGSGKVQPWNKKENA